MPSPALRECRALARPGWPCARALAASLLLLLRQPAGAVRLSSKHEHGSLRVVLSGESAERRRDSENNTLPTLFCFMLVRPNTEDVATLPLHMEGKMLSGCDGYAVYSNVSLAELMGNNSYVTSDDMQLFSQHAPPAVMQGNMDVLWEQWPEAPAKAITYTASNTAVFMQAWKHIWMTEMHLKYDWIVKVDPDAIIIPDRMRLLLQDRMEPIAAIFDGEATKCGDNGMGGVTAVTRGFADGMQGLYAQMGDLGAHREDSLMAAYASLFKNWPVLDEPNFKLNGPVLESECNSTWKAAFHPFKEPKWMMRCLELVRHSTANPDRSKLHTTCL